MKPVKLIIIGMILFVASVAQAQVKENENKLSPPLWGPVGYENVRYYYLPDLETYYDVQISMFIYYNGRAWIYRTHLPLEFSEYDLYGGYKVVMTDYEGSTPYTHFNEQKVKYPKGYHGEMQKTIGDKPGLNEVNLDTLSKDYSIKKFCEDNSENAK